MYRELKTDAALESEGFWIAYYRGDGEHDFRVRVARLTPTHPRYAKAIEQGLRPHRRNLQRGGVPTPILLTVQRNAFIDVADEVVTDWQRWLDGEWVDGIEAEDGEDTLEFTPAHVRQTLENLPELCDELHNEALSAGNFLRETREADAGN